MKINNKLLQIFLSVIGMAMLLLPDPLLAQETGSLSLTLLPDEYDHEVTAGYESSFSLEVRNTGDENLTNIKLSANVAEDWIILFDPDSIDSLSAGSLQTVNVKIRPDLGMDNGEYKVTFIAEANETRKVESVWVKVKSSSLWLWVIGGVAILVVAVFVFIYMRLNSQKVQ
jgi:uncharacterized membrane protein